MTDKLIYIDDQNKLDELSRSIENTSKIAIDLEFDKNHYTYGFNICLIQLFDGKNCYLIDPLTIPSLSSLFEIFENESVELITFAFGEDFRLLNHLGCSPTNITDLSTVRSLLNHPQSSLTSVLIEELGIQSSKDFQRSNWCLRPLSEEQKIYAAEDVIYLFDLTDKLMNELIELDRFSWLEDEKIMLEESLGEVPANFNSTYYKERKIMNLPQWERFKVLVDFREKYAEKLNKPTYKVVDRDVLADFAIKNDVSGWMNQKRIHPSLKKESVVRELNQLLEEANEKIRTKGLTDDMPAREMLSQIEKADHSKRKMMIHRVSEDVLMPIKNVITKEYGEQLSTFMLSKRMMERLIVGDLKLPSYRLKIIKEAAISLGFSEDKLSFLN